MKSFFSLWRKPFLAVTTCGFNGSRTIVENTVKQPYPMRWSTISLKALLLLLAMGLSVNVWGADEKISYSGASSGNMTGNNDAASVGLNANNWSVVADKGGNGNYPGLNKAGQIRLYGATDNHNVITVTNLDNNKITSIKVTYEEDCYNAKVTVGSAEVTGTGSNTEKTYSINSTSFSIAHNYTANTQVHILSIEITYSSSAPTVSVTGVSLDKASANVKQDEQLQLTATVTPNDATNKNVSWSVSGNDKVHVSTEGLVSVDYDAIVNSTATVTATTADGEYTASCTITVVENTAERFAFSFTSTPTGWPAEKANAAAGEYTYTLNSVDYEFTHTKASDGIYGKFYLMVNNGNALGLPVLQGYKLVKVVATNSGGCSQSVNVAVSKTTSTTSATDVVGASQKWSTQNSAYTYNLTGTTYDTRYYVVISSANAQITGLTLSYEQKPAVTGISIAQAPSKVDYKVGDKFNPAGLQISVNYGGVIPAENITYNEDTKAEFTFNPSLETGLAVTDTKVTISHSGKSADQAITVTRYATEITAEDNKEIKVGDGINLTDWYTITDGYNGTISYASNDDETFLVLDDMAEAEKVGSAILTITAPQTDKYEGTSKQINVSIISASAPQLFVDETELTWENIPVGESGEGKNLTISGDNLVGDITLAIEGTDADQFSVTPTSIAQAEAIGEVTVTYSPTVAGDHSATLKISSTNATTLEVALTGNALAKYTAKWSINGEIDNSKNEIVIDGNKVTTVPSTTSCDEDNIAFLGWTNTTIADAAVAPAILFTDVASAPAVTEDVTYHAVFAEIGGTGEMLDKELTTAEFDTWTVSSSNTSQESNYRKLSEGGWVETAEIDLSKITKIVVYGGTFGGDSNNKLNIQDASGNLWKAVTVSGNSQTGVNTYTGGNALVGNGKIRVISGSTSVRVSKVIVYTQEPDITYSHYSTTCVPPLVAPTLTVGGEYCTSVDVTISKGENPDGVTLMYSTDGGTDWNTYSTTLTITTTTTIKAKAVLGPKESEPAEATYTILPHYSDLTALKEVASTEEVQKACVSFSNLLVNATNVNTVYLTDGTNVYLINKNSHGFSRGQKLSTGEHAILPYKLYNGVLEFNDSTGITVSSSDNETPATTMAVNAITAADYGKLVKIENVIYNDGVFTDASSNTIKLGNNIVNASSWLTNGAIYDITGIITTQMIEEVSTLTISPRAKESDVVSKAEKLAAPSNLTYENLTGSSVTLKWGEVTDAEKYDVEVYDGSTRVKNNQTKSLSYSPKDLTSGKTYTWRVRAVGNDLTTSTGDWTDGTATFTTLTPATLYWIVNGDTEHPFATTTAASEKVVMPTTDPTSACSDNYQDFICWVNNPIEGVRTEKIYDNMRVSTSTPAKSNTDGTLTTYTFYAAFGKVKTEGSDVYTLVTEAPDGWAGDYLIAQSESKFANGYYSGTKGIGKEGNYVDLSSSIVDNTIDAAIGNPYHVTFETCDGGYLMKSQSGYYNYKSSNANGIDSTQSVNTADDYPITISLNDGGTVHMSLTNGAKFQYNNGSSGYFRFYKSDSNQDDCYLYKRTLTPKTYSAYITTCPTFYDITIDDQIVGGEVAATPNATIEAGTTIQLTATASAGYTAEGGTWTVTNETTIETITVNKNNQFTMPTSNVTVSYAFVALVDNFQDALHGAADQTGVGAQYDLPSLANTTEGTRKDAFFKFAGWVSADTEITTGEPATAKPTILDGKQNATGATYKALWANATETAFVTEECNTAIPTNLYVVNEALTANSAKLDWNNVTNATKYHVSVYQATSLVVETDVESSEYVATGLTAATEYTFTVKAYKDCWGYEADAVQFTTKDAAVPHLVTLVAENGQIEITPELTEGNLLEGTVATVTATAADGYYFVSWNFTNVTPASVNGNEATFAMPTKAVTITANFAEIPKVTWKLAGEEDRVIASVPNGNKFEIGSGNVQPVPETWKDQDSFPTFVGWVINGWDEKGKVTEPTFATANTEVPAEGLTVMGVVAKSATPDCSQATKVTSNENLDMDAYYLMGIEHDAKTKYFYELNSNWAKVSEDYTTNTPYLFTISGDADALAILSKDGYVKGQISSFGFSKTETTVVLTAAGLMQHSTETETCGLAYNHNSGNGGIRWYKTSSISSSSYPLAYLYKVPMIYEDMTVNPLTNVVVKEKDTLTIDKDWEENELKVKTGATLRITNGATLKVRQLTLQGGMSEDGKSYSVPNVEIAAEASLVKEIDTVNLEMRVCNQKFHPLAVPFPAKVSEIDYVDPVLKAESVYGKHYVIKTYDGARRAEYRMNADNWITMSVEDTLKPGVGYFLQAIAVAGYDSLIRIPMVFCNRWTEKGEQGTVDDTTKNKQEVIFHNSPIHDDHSGWNMVSMPFMFNYSAAAEENIGNEITYVSMPDSTFSRYTQEEVAKITLRPEWSFFVQVAKTGNLDFKQKVAKAEEAPYRLPQYTTDEEKPEYRIALTLTGAHANNKTTLKVSDRYTEAYEIGKDLEKMFGEAYTLETYTVMGDNRLAYNALPTEKMQQSVPVGYRAPEQGDYTFTAQQNAENTMEHLYLTDRETGIITDLLVSSYTFSSARTQDDDRFVLKAEMRAPSTPTALDEAIRNSHNGLQKVVYQGKLYIVNKGVVYDGQGRQLVIK